MLAQISIFPIGKESLSEDVAKVVAYIKQESIERKLKYELTSMATLIEGKDDDVWEVLKGCYNTMLRDNNRIYTTITIDSKKGRDNTLEYKKRRIEQILEE